MKHSGTDSVDPMKSFNTEMSKLDLNIYAGVIFTYLYLTSFKAEIKLKLIVGTKFNLGNLKISEGRINVKIFFIMYFGLQDTKPPPCPLHLTKQGGSIHC